MSRIKVMGAWAGAVLAALWIAGCGAGEAGKEPPQEQEKAAAKSRVETQDIAAEETDRAQEEAPEAIRPEEPEMAGEAETTPADTAESQDETAAEPQAPCLSIVGDSISTYEGWIPDGCHNFYPMSGEITDVSQTWWSLLLKDTGMKLCANNSSSGSMCAGDSLAQDVQCGCSSYRLAFTAGRQGQTPDLIIVYMGTNDLVEGVPLGDNDGTAAVAEGKVDNFSDAYCLMLDKLESEYPAAEICCCTLAQVGNWGVDQPFVAFENGLGLTAADYAERIRLIAGNKGMRVADLYHCGIEIDNLTEMTSDGVHLTPEGMKCAEAAILNALQNGFADGEQ